MLDAVRNAFRLPDLRRKLLISFGILVVYRLAAHVPLPGVNRDGRRPALPHSGPLFRRGYEGFSGDETETKRAFV